MYAKKVTIQNQTGLHARPASAFVAAASKFSSTITIRKFDDAGNELNTCPAKSIVFVLSLALSKGTTIELVAEGPDEQEAVDALVALVESGFGEA